VAQGLVTLLREMEVDCRRLQVEVTEQNLDRFQIGSAFQKVGCPTIDVRLQPARPLLERETLACQDQRPSCAVADTNWSLHHAFYLAFCTIRRF